MLSKFIYLNSIRGNIHFLDPALYLLISIYWNGLPSLRSLRCFLLSLRSHQVIVAVTNDIRVPVVFHLLEWTAVFTESEMLPPLIEVPSGHRRCLKWHTRARGWLLCCVVFYLLGLASQSSWRALVSSALVKQCVWFRSQIVMGLPHQQTLSQACSGEIHVQYSHATVLSPDSRYDPTVAIALSPLCSSSVPPSVSPGIIQKEEQRCTNPR